MTPQPAAVPAGLVWKPRTNQLAGDECAAAYALVMAVSERILARQGVVAAEAADDPGQSVRLWGVSAGLAEAHSMVMDEMVALWRLADGRDA